MASSFVGTSGWIYPHWAGTFYPDDLKERQHLVYYSERFRTVELNNSFYNLPKPETFRKWRETVPDDFIFAVKASRYITHRKYLKEPQRTTERFLQNVAPLEEKLGPILFQLPPGWGNNPERLAEFLKVLPGQYRYTFEFRNPSWFNDEVYEMLRESNIAFCLYELAAVRTPDVITADFVYLRMHGPESSKYTGQYSEARLQELAGKIRTWMDHGKDVYCYFDNDQKGYAAQDAARLQQILAGASESRFGDEAGSRQKQVRASSPVPAQKP